MTCLGLWRTETRRRKRREPASTPLETSTTTVATCPFAGWARYTGPADTNVNDVFMALVYKT